MNADDIEYTIRRAHYDYRKSIRFKEFLPYPKTPENKGVKGKNCNRTACQVSGAEWFNLSTRAYYYNDCAQMINAANAYDALSLYGHPFLCVSPLDTAHYPQ